MVSRSGQKHNLRVLGLVCVATAALLAFGCGGGGGDSSGSSPSLTYAGLTTQATITEANARDLVAGAADMSESGGAFLDIAALNDPDQNGDDSRSGLLITIAQSFQGAVSQIDLSATTATDMAAAIQSAEETIQGSCGGSATIRLSLNDQTGAFNGRMTFNGYCEDGATMNGSASISGEADMATEQFKWYQVNFDYITSSSGSESVTLDGSIRFDMTAYDTVYATMNMMVRDDQAGEVFMVQNYQVQISEGSGGVKVEIAIDGRYYDPHEGYVDIDTTVTFVIMYGDDNPSSGVLTVTGANNSSARLTAISSTQCLVEVDADGDGAYEYSSGNISWNEL